MKVLVANMGSTSYKYKVFDLSESRESVVAKGGHERVQDHGPVIEDPRAAAARLVAHRGERERKVRAAVAAGAATVPDITDRAYDDKDVSAVRSMAEGTVRAHLEKLAAEGHLDWDGERATPA